MERVMRLTVLISAMVLMLGARSVPVDYAVTNRGSVMTIALKGPVEWQESYDGTSMNIILSGPSKNFIVKNIRYTFRDGVIRSFAMQAVHPDTQVITMEIRKSQQYQIFYNPSSKRLNIIFHGPGAVLAAVKQGKKESAPVKENKKIAAPVKEIKKAAAPITPIDIAVIAAEPEPAAKAETQQRNDDGFRPIPERSNDIGTSAMLLFVASTVIVIAGGGAVAYVLLNKKRSSKTLSVPPQQQPFLNMENALYHNVPEEDEIGPEFEQAIEYAEQYLRTQGEFDLQQRLEHLNRSSMNRKMEHALVNHPAARKTTAAAAAQKLGISVGELELASRLRDFQQEHITEQQ
jgi:hypothetical protein